ncbi:MAG: hypothetical protein ABSC53_11590, partial [Bacteroidota bacterium]
DRDKYERIGMNLFRYQHNESYHCRINNRSRKAGSTIRPRFDWKASNLSNRDLLVRRLFGGAPVR